MERSLQNIILEEKGESLAYTPVNGGSGETNYPCRKNRKEHASYLKKQLECAWNDAMNETETVASTTVRDGVYLQFEGKSEYDLITKSLEDVRQHVRLLNVSEDDKIKRATVYVPAAKKDFFLRKINIYEDGEIISFPLQEKIPTGYAPLIVPPGKEKYSTTHEEPYRTIIEEADREFKKAGSFLCIGYGFNDSHIQPKLISQIKSGGKPIVVITKKATDECLRLVADDVLNSPLYISYARQGTVKMKNMNERWKAVYEIWNGSDNGDNK